MIDPRGAMAPAPRTRATGRDAPSGSLEPQELALASPAEQAHAASSTYWYPEDRETTAVDVLNLLRRYRAAEVAMRARTRTSMRMNDTDLVALRHLLRAQRAGELVRQRDLAGTLGISTASVTALVDRLAASGHVERRAHPSDRRATVLVATADSDREVREVLGSLHRRMIDVVDAMTPDQLAAVAQFLDGMATAVESTAPIAATTPAGSPAREGSALPARTA